MMQYKGKGEHSLNELEQIIQEREEELHLYRSGQKQLPLSDYAEKKLEFIIGHHIVRYFPEHEPTKEWAGAVMDLLEELNFYKH